MNRLILCMNILHYDGHLFHIEISDKKEACMILFCPVCKVLKIEGTGDLSCLLKRNIYQLKKILHTKRASTYTVGFTLRFVISDLKDIEAFNDHSKITILDKREETLHCYIAEEGEKNIVKLYTDGCYLQDKKTGGYAAIIKSKKQQLSIIYGKTGDAREGNNLAELLAAVKGLQKLEKTEKIRIITDSRYVKKGLTEWIINWKLNNWITSSGTKVKNINEWKQFDALTNNKYIEFEWVKAHAGHYENCLCDYYARQAAES